MRAEIIDSVEDNFYKPVDEKKLDDASLKGIVDSLDDPYSHYLTPKEAKQFNELGQRAFRGRRHERRAGQARAEGAARVRWLTRRERGHPPGRLHPRRERPLDRRREQRCGHQPHQGAGGHDRCTLRVFTPGEDARPHREGEARAHRDPGGARPHGRERPATRSASWSCSASATAPTVWSASEVDKLLQAGSRGDRVRPARQRRRPAVRGRAGVEHLHRGRQDRLRARAPPRRSARRTPRATPSTKTIPVVTLVDGGSASASEIVTGALRDRKRAKVVGTRTFGKGLVQEIQQLSNGGVLDITVANYYLPDGETISTKGIKPEIRAVDDPDTDRDEALPVALDDAAFASCNERRRAWAPRPPARQADGRGAREARPLPGRGAAVRTRAAHRGGTRRRGYGRPRAGRLGKARRTRAAQARPARSRPRRGRGADAGSRALPLATRAPRARRRTAPLHDPYAADARVDLRELPTFTIDPDDARDFDDAISARREDGRVRLWVHIADVTAYLRPGGRLERETFRRGTSVYVPGAVEPMLPEVLSNEACSLRPGEDRLAVTVEMEMNGADVTSVAFHRSLVRSDRRLTYGEVDELFAGRTRAEDPWGEPLEVAREVARRAARASRLARVRLLGAELRLRFRRPPDGRPLRAADRVAPGDRDADDPRERAGGRATWRTSKLPTLYRVHERPEPQSVTFLDRAAGESRHPDAAAAKADDTSAGGRRDHRDLADRGERVAWRSGRTACSCCVR